MDIERKFIDLCFLDKEIVEISKKQLENTFGIDIYELINTINVKVDKELFVKDMDSWIDEISPIIYPYIRTYCMDFREHFSRIEYFDESFVFLYIVENLKLNLYLYNINKNKKKRSLSQIEAVKKYIELERDENLKERYLSNDTKKKDSVYSKYIREQNCRNYSRIVTMNTKKYRQKNSSRFKEINLKDKEMWELFFNDESLKKNKTKKYKEELSNIFIELMYNLGKTSYGNDYKPRGKYKFELEIDQMKNFFNKKVDIYEKYFWERINNTAFIKHAYDICCKNKFDYMIAEACIKYVKYLPNVFLNGIFLEQLLHQLCLSSKSYNNYKAEVETKVRDFCFQLAFIVIPLFNKIFSVIMRETDKVLRNKNYTSQNYYEQQKSNEDKYYKLCLETLNIKSDKKQMDIRLITDILYLVRKNINFKLFDFNQITSSIGVFDKKLLKIVSDIYQLDVGELYIQCGMDVEKYKYQKMVKNFMVEIINFSKNSTC